MKTSAALVLVDKPYVSDFLKETIRKNAYPLIDTGKTPESSAAGKDGQPPKFSWTQIYTTSENSIGWIVDNMSKTDLPEKIDLFKDKIRFRELIASIYPDFYFRRVPLQELESMDLTDIPMPFIIKPAKGFFSMGVHKVATPSDWPRVREAIQAEILHQKDLYPKEVFDTDSFIIEQCIDGEEFAFDAYFDREGKAVLLNIYKHIFSSDEDVSDRVYLSSKTIIEENLDRFTSFLQEVGTLAGVKNFPVHVEIRCDQFGSLLPIEVNPMRFGGWCTTADMTWFSYGFNPYEYYFSQKRPDWPQILEGREGKLYSIIILDNSTGIDGGDIAAFDYELLLERFEKPLELRKIDYLEYPVFGFLFAETKEECFDELEFILNSDLNEFVRQNS